MCMCLLVCLFRVVSSLCQQNNNSNNNKECRSYYHVVVICLLYVSYGLVCCYLSCAYFVLSAHGCRSGCAGPRGCTSGSYIALFVLLYLGVFMLIACVFTSGSYMRVHNQSLWAYWEPFFSQYYRDRFDWVRWIQHVVVCVVVYLWLRMSVHGCVWARAIQLRCLFQPTPWAISCPLPFHMFR